MALVFAIVGKNELVFDMALSPGSVHQQPHVHQFVLHSALDVMGDKMWGTPAMNLKVVDEFNELQVHGWCTASGAHFMMLHDSLADESSRRMRVEENIKNFFSEVNDLFTRIVLNPFYQPETKITSKTFADRVATLARKWSLA